MQPTVNVLGSIKVSDVDTGIFPGTATAELLGVIPSRYGVNYATLHLVRSDSLQLVCMASDKAG